MKKCLRCGIEKDESEFHKDKKQKDGLKIYCKECIRNHNREHKEQINATKRKYALEHPEQTRQYQKKYRETHRKQINEYAKKKQSQKREWVRSFKIPCAKCGESRLYVIDYHHVDHREKNIDLGSSFSDGYATKDELLREIKKCICLCKNCHAEYHWIYGANPELPVESLTEYIGCNPRDKVVKMEDSK